MPVSVSYPGVYVQEVSSGVRTIVGVGTSIAMFIGRTRMGKLDQPERCLSYDDFVRKFDSSPDGELATSVRLFFTNGGTECFVTRIARNATAAEVTLGNEAAAPQPVLRAIAKSAGTFGDDIRLAIDYNTLEPEATFNLEVFRWNRGPGGALQKTLTERFLSLSMDPAHPRFAPPLVTSASKLIDLSDRDALNAPLAGAIAPTPGFSQSGFAVSSATPAVFRSQWLALIGSTATSNRFGISVDGNAPVTVDLSSLDFAAGPSVTNPNPLNTGPNAVANLAGRIQELINRELPAGALVAVTLPAGPAGPAAPGTPDNVTTVTLRITSANGDVRIVPASSNDLAVRLMLGTAQGGLEVSRFAMRRPAPTAWVFNGTAASLTAFAQTRQDAFDTLVVDSVSINVSAIATTVAPVVEPRIYQDAGATTQNDGRGGVREKLAVLAAAVIAARASDPDFGWTAEVWGNRLALIATGGPDSKVAAVSTRLGLAAGPALATNPVVNQRHVNLGATIGAPVYFALGVAGNPGATPQPDNYAAIYPLIDSAVDLFNLLILPRDNDMSDADRKKLWGPASVFCQQRRAFLLIDPPSTWTNADNATGGPSGVNSLRIGLVKDHSAVFYPRLTIDDRGVEKHVDPAGAIAGLMARIDGTRGVWKASAGTEADLRGVLGVEIRFSDRENGVLNPKAVNTIRVFPNGIVSWGARTMDGDDAFGSEYKYIPVRRLALFMEESLYRGLKWAVFEPNDEPLWAQIRLNVGAFMHNLFRQGAFQGATPREAYFVRCDASTTTQNDRNLGVVNIIVGFAPLKPAEFVVLTLQQMAGQIQV